MKISRLTIRLAVQEAIYDFKISECSHSKIKYLVDVTIDSVYNALVRRPLPSPKFKEPGLHYEGSE